MPIGGLAPKVVTRRGMTLPMPFLTRRGTNGQRGTRTVQMVTHRGTAQNDVTIRLAAEPAGGPRSEATLVSYATALAPTGSAPGCTLQCPMTDCAEWRGSLTIPSSAASEASPLQRVVRLTERNFASLESDG